MALAPAASPLRRPLASLPALAACKEDALVMRCQAAGQCRAQDIMWDVLECNCLCASPNSTHSQPKQAAQHALLLDRTQQQQQQQRQ